MPRETVERRNSRPVGGRRAHGGEVVGGTALARDGPLQLAA